MEPLVASKLHGDYRTGKRINMKRVIGYIASGYRKDKIWLRRTKPGKRNYHVLLAADNSESMKSLGVGNVALLGLSTLKLANWVLRLVHLFKTPFTASSGADVVSNFRFKDTMTRTALCDDQ